MSVHSAMRVTHTDRHTDNVKTITPDTDVGVKS